jgi:hypothetical protein
LKIEIKDDLAVIISVRAVAIMFQQSSCLLSADWLEVEALEDDVQGLEKMLQNVKCMKIFGTMHIEQRKSWSGIYS